MVDRWARAVITQESAHRSVDLAASMQGLARRSAAAWGSVQGWWSVAVRQAEAVPELALAAGCAPQRVWQRYRN